jgi:formate dehydrogenase maturation protein FdhE
MRRRTRIMTLDKYLENHDVYEGAEDTFVSGVKRCPICGSDECEAYAIRDGEIVGCDNCLFKVWTYVLDIGTVNCANCAEKDVEYLYFRHKDGAITEIVGCDKCIREVLKWRWEAKA